MLARLTAIVGLPPGLNLFNFKISSVDLPVILNIFLNSGESTPALIAWLNSLIYCAGIIPVPSLILPAFLAALN